MNKLSQHKCFGGTVTYWQHMSESTRCSMRFTVFLPPQAEQEKCPALFFLSGMTSTEENFTTKAGAYRTAAKLGLIIIVPDTSPRGPGVPDDSQENIGQGASFYLDATEMPWAQHYRMEQYVTHELYALALKHFPLAENRIGISGHSMGGHGALTLYLRRPELYRSVSAFAPVCAPALAGGREKMLTAYLGSDRTKWKEHDATALMHASTFETRIPILIDQGMKDSFRGSLHAELFEAACLAVNHPLKLRLQPGYDHGYFFIQSFIDDHLHHHAALLLAN